MVDILSKFVGPMYGFPLKKVTRLNRLSNAFFLGRGELTDKFSLFIRISGCVYSQHIFCYIYFHNSKPLTLKYIGSESNIICLSDTFVIIYNYYLYALY